MSHSGDRVSLLADDNDLDAVAIHGNDEEATYGSMPSVRISDRKALDRTSATRQLAASLAYCLGAFSMGNMLGWSSSALPELETPSIAPGPVDQSQASLIGALICLGAGFQVVDRSLLDRWEISTTGIIINPVDMSKV